MPDIAWVDQTNRDLTALWQNFLTKRKDNWDPIIRRDAVVDLPDDLKPYAGGIQIKSPSLEYELGERGDIKTINPTKVGCVSLDEAKEATADVEEVRIWFGSLMQKWNKNRYLDRAKAEGQDRYGLAIERMFWSMPEESGDITDREAYFKDLNSDCWDIQPVHPLECRFSPCIDPTIFIQESEVTYMEGTKLRNEDGGFVSLDDAGKVVFLGARQPLNSITTAQAGKKLRVVTIAWLEPGTEDEWHIAEYIYQTGTNLADGGAQLSDKLVPFKRCPYFITPAGSQRAYETDPDLHFRPRMYASIVTMGENNQWQTLLAAFALKFSTNFYWDISSLTPEARSFMSELGVEGDGAHEYLVFKMPQPGSNEMQGLPHVERFPFELPDVIKEIVQRNKEEMVRYQPSRFQTGGLSRTEVSEGTATVEVDMRQASSLPFSADLELSDATYKDELLAAEACVKYWDEGARSGASKKYFTAASQDIPVIGKQPDPGTQVWVDVNKLNQPKQIVVVTRNKTQAEDQQDALLAFQDEKLGIITHRQTLERRGFDDAGKQEEELEQERIEKLFQPMADEVDKRAVATIYSALTGINLVAAGGGSMPNPQLQQGQPPTPNPTQPQVIPAPVQMQGGSSGSAPGVPG